MSFNLFAVFLVSVIVACLLFYIFCLSLIVSSLLSLNWGLLMFYSRETSFCSYSQAAPWIWYHFRLAWGFWLSGKFCKCLQVILSLITVWWCASSLPLISSPDISCKFPFVCLCIYIMCLSQVRGLLGHLLLWDSHLNQCKRASDLWSMSSPSFFYCVTPISSATEDKMEEDTMLKPS